MDSGNKDEIAKQLFDRIELIPFSLIKGQLHRGNQPQQCPHALSVPIQKQSPLDPSKVEIQMPIRPCGTHCALFSLFHVGPEVCARLNCAGSPHIIMLGTMQEQMPDP